MHHRALNTGTFLLRLPLCEASPSSNTQNDPNFFALLNYTIPTTHAKFGTFPMCYAFSSFFPPEMPVKRSHTTNLATFVENG